MRYWVYINDKVDGPYDENKLVTLNGFSQDTLICSEEVASNGGQEWVKASSVFEFDEVPVEEEPVEMPDRTVRDIPTAVTNEMDTNILLAKLDSLTEELSHLHEKLDSMQTHLDEALEQNKQLANQAALQSQADVLPAQPLLQENSTNTITLPPNATEPGLEEKPKEEETPHKTEESLFANQAAPKEEELIIRSALDSIYGEKLVTPAPAATETFQDLLPEKEMEKVEQIEKELTFFPVDDQTETAPVKEALITTPSAEEAARDELINELTASPKEDILDQIIQEHQAEQEAQNSDQPQETPVQEEPAAQADTKDSSLGTAAAVGVAAAAVAGVAAVAALGGTDKQEQPAEEKAAETPAKEEAETPVAADEKPADKQEDLPIELDLHEELDEQTPAVTETEKPQEEPLASLAQEAEPLVIATDKNDPTHLEEVLPADQLPPDVSEVPQPAEVAQSADLPEIPDVPQTSTTPQAVVDTMPEQPAQQLASLDSLDNLGSLEEKKDEPSVEQQPAADFFDDAAEELVPGKSLEDKPQSSSIQNPTDLGSGILTEQDIEKAFEEPQDISISPTSVEVPENNNPNDLTEIELKEGSTYLISDFVPPAQVTDDPSELMLNPGDDDRLINKKQETIIQDMLAVTNKTEQTQVLPTEGLPDDVVANKVSLENTIQAKRGASLDIKTVPMVPEPGNTQRLDVDELNDINAQHDKTSYKSGKGLAKIVIGALVGLLLLIVLYVALGLFNFLPSSVNLFAKPNQTTQTSAEELLSEQEETSPAEEEQPSNGPAEQALSKVQNFPLPNGYTLRQFIESKHAGVSSDLITWEVVDAVEPDNYSITVKVPPENPQNFKTVYRFNYNTKSGLLDPTISDAKNLLDQAYGMAKK